MRKAYTINPARIYLTFARRGSLMLIRQISKDLEGNIFLERERIVRKPCEKHMRLGLTGTIITTKN